MAYSLRSDTCDFFELNNEAWGRYGTAIIVDRCHAVQMSLSAAAAPPPPQQQQEQQQQQQRKVAVVVGAGDALGSAIARAFARESYVRSWAGESADEYVTAD